MIVEGYGILNSHFNNIRLDIGSFGTLYLITSYVTMAVSVAALISYFLLLIGINKVNFAFLNQFKIFYIFFLIYDIYSAVVNGFLLSNDKYIDKMVELTKYQYIDIVYAEDVDMVNEEEKVKDLIKSSGRTSLFFSFVFFILILYYYLTTCSYIEDIEEKEIEDNEARNLEENNY